MVNDHGQHLLQAVQNSARSYPDIANLIRPTPSSRTPVARTTAPRKLVQLRCWAGWQWAATSTGKIRRESESRPVELRSAPSTAAVLEEWRHLQFGRHESENSCLSDLVWSRASTQTPITPTNSFTAAALLSSPAFSSAVSLISIICSIPFAPSLTGTPT
jgi:hypothetical protein